MSTFFVSAQVQVPFVQRTSQYTPTQQVYHVKGDFAMIGNTNLTLQSYGPTTPNNSNAMIYVDVDSPEMMGLHGTPTYNSSAATLTLSTENGANPACSNIIYAGLYWTGRAHNASPSNLTFTATKDGVSKVFDKRKIQLKGPLASEYTEFTAPSNNIYYPSVNGEYMYSAYAEVTDYVRTNGIGEYIAADIALRQGDGGGTGYYGGWGMVVIYENSNMEYRDITLFDGHAFVQAQTASFDIPVSGFNTVQNGPVGIKMGMMAGEGDVFIPNDYFRIRKLNTNNFQTLSHSGNTPDNFFNSSIATGGNPRNPNLLNNTGLDISMFDIPNVSNSVIGNGQTSTTFRYGSTGDTYIIFAVVMAVDAYVPEAEGVISAVGINGAPAGPTPYTVEPGDELQYKIEVRNRGNEAISNTKITIPVPYNAVYIAGSAATTVFYNPLPTPNTVTFEPSMGANGSLVWALGTLPLAADEQTVLADMTFKFRVTQDCDLLANATCSNMVAVNGAISGTGAVTNVTVTNAPLIRGYTELGECAGIAIPGPLSATIDAAAFVSQNCSGTPQVTSFIFCDVGNSIPLTDISGGFPAGTLFYNQYPVINGTSIQYTVSNPFPATMGNSTYFAVPPGAVEGCYFQFTITVSNSTSVPVPQDVSYWVGADAVPITATASQPGYTLYYFTSQNAPAQVSITPSTEFAGQTTYFVAEGPSPSCIGPLVPLVVTVYPFGQMNAPENMSLMGCGLNPLTQLPFSSTAVSITVEQFIAAGGSLGFGNSPCNFTISYTDTAVGTCPITVTRVFALSDECEFSATAVQIITIGNNSGPVFQPLPEPTTLACGSLPVFATAIAIDDCEGLSTATYVDSVVEGACSGSYSVTRLWTATDGCGNISTASQTIHFSDTTPPTITNTAQNIIIQCNQGINAAIGTWLAINGGASAQDNCSDITWTHDFSAEQMDCSAPVTVIFTATDSCGNFSNTAATITSIDNIAPIAPAPPANVTVPCSTAIPAPIALTATDNCEGHITVLPTEILTPGTCANSYSILRTWTFTDACTNTSSISQLVTVSDQTDPVFNETPPQNTTVNCGFVPDPAVLTANDNCDTNISVQFTEIITPGSCESESTILRTWKAIDSCGNEVDHTQTILVIDNEEPELVGTFESELNIICGQLPEIPELEFTDNCSIPTVVYSEVTTNTDANSYTVVRNWHVSDACGNSKDFSQTINMTDAPEPIMVTGYAACNTDIGLTVDLADLLPANTAENGVFTDVSNTGSLQNGIFSPNGLPVGNYLFDYEAATNGCPEKVTITITVDDDCFVIPACSILVHNAITPNDDGRNDVFLIENIDNTVCFPTNYIEIYNRWGVLVYETAQYNNRERSFRGLSDGRVTVDRSSELPTGTYFFMLRYTTADGNAIQSNGYLYLSR